MSREAGRRSDDGQDGRADHGRRVIFCTRPSMVRVCRERHDYRDVVVRATQDAKAEDAEAAIPARDAEHDYRM